MVESELFIHKVHKGEHKKSQSSIIKSNCNLCKEKFTSRKDLIMHKKSKHSEKVYTCQDNVILVNRIAGLCTVERPVILAILAMNGKIVK